MVSTHQAGMRAKHALRPRKTVKFCGTCGGKHAGYCQFITTRHGTRCRPDILEIVEARSAQS